MVETTKTAEALETAVGGQGVMQSEYFKLKYNPETGRWEKEKVTEDVVPTFPGIRDVTPDYTSEGKTFKTIPIGAGPDYTPVPPVVTPTPTPPVEPPVETPTEPVTPIVTEPVARDVDVSNEQIEREKIFKPKDTFVDTDGVTKKAIVSQPNYRTKYTSMPGGLNNMSDAQVLQYAIETGALNQILPQANNPYYVAPPEEKEGIMADVVGASSIPLQLGAMTLDMTLGKASRKALVKRLVDANILFGDASNYIDENGKFKTTDLNRLVKVFKDEDTPMNGLISEAELGKVEPLTLQRDPFKVSEDKDIPFMRQQTVQEYFGTKQGESKSEANLLLSAVNDELESLERKKSRTGLRNEADINRYNELIQEKNQYESILNVNNLSEGEQNELDALTRKKNKAGLRIEADKNRYDELIAKRDGAQELIFDPRGKSADNPEGPGFKTITPGLLEQLENLKRTQINALEGAQTMAQVGVTGLSGTVNPLRQTATFIDGLKQAKIKRTKVNGINYQFVDAGISEAQPVVGLSGDSTNGEKVYLDSNAGFYNSQGQYVADDNGDGIADKVRGGSASEAAEAANAGYIPQKLLDRMTNPDGSLKNLYDPTAKDFVGGKYKLTLKTADNPNGVVEIRDGKSYYVGNVVKENRDVVDNGGDGNVVDNAAPDNSNDNQNYEFKKQQEEKKESGGPAGMGSQPETSGGGSGGGSADKKDKIVCTEMYRQTQLDDWQRTIKLWYLFQKKYLSETHQKGYHFLFKPFVKGMQKSNILTSIGRHFAQERTKDIKHIMYGTKFSLLGRVYRIILEPICFVVGLLLWQKK